jgi:hypothetical protein
MYLLWLVNNTTPDTMIGAPWTAKARAAAADKGAREEAHRLREKDRQRSEQLGAALSSRDFAWSRLDAVGQIHEVVGGKCRCGLSADRCQTLPLLTGRGMPPRNWRVGDGHL